MQVIERNSAAKASIGSAFFVSADGLVITNYHVISSVIQSPERYRAKLTDVAGRELPAEVLGVDVIHDLAVLSSGTTTTAYFGFANAKSVLQGRRLYSLGHPEDLGLTIVEGTYNGLLQHTLYPRIHFTGAINPGMSGGPVITERGEVVGVNVSTAGNELGFLVPADRAEQLLRQVSANGPTGAVRTLEQVGTALRAFQEGYLAGMFAGEASTVALGPFRVVTQPAPFFRCWADAARSADQTVETVRHRCATDDYLFIAGDHSTGTVTVDHQLIRSRTLNPNQFYTVYSAAFANPVFDATGEEHVSAWHCRSQNVKQRGPSMRVVLCVRGYRKLTGLYDAMLKVATLGYRNVGLISTLSLSGATFENVQAVTRRYLERVTWR